MSVVPIHHKAREADIDQTLELWLHRSGFKHPNEPMACHARRRYRLLPSKNPNTGIAPPDPSLWIVHYQKAERRDCIPSQSIQIQPQVQMIVQQRRLLQSYGQLARKEFMLHDRNNWPVINLPAAVPPMSHAQAFANNLARQTQANIMGSQQAGTMTGPMAAANRATQMAHVRGRSTNLLAGDVAIEEEEDVSRGDMLDFMTPREISKMRYEHHHEWMEEIMNSPFATKEIIPTDLGLGRKGELEALTNSVFEAPTGIMREASMNGVPKQVGRLELNKAEEFTKMAARKVSEMQAELDKMQRKHERRIAKLRKTSVLNSAEKRLRTATETAEPRPTRVSGETIRDTSKSGIGESVEDIIQEVEAAWGRKIEPMTSVVCIQRGGLDHRTRSNNLSGRHPMNGLESPSTNVTTREDPNPSTHAQPVPQIDAEEQHESSGPSHSTQTPSALVGTPTVRNDDEADNNGPEFGPEDFTNQDDTAVPSLDDMDVDMEMAGLEDPDHGLGDEDDGNTGNEWVMVDEQGDDVGNPTDADTKPQPSPTPQQGDTSGSPATFVNTPGSGIHSLPQNVHESNFNQATVDTPDFGAERTDSQSDFDNVGMGVGDGGLGDYGDDEDLGMDVMDDSAFGDAFHPPEDSNTMEGSDFS
jgi:hypothetical protein